MLQRLLSNHAVKSTAFSGIIVQISRPLISLVTLPLLLDKLGQAGLGVWMIALSLMGLVATFNAGLSISLVTLIGRASSGQAKMDLHRLATAAFLIATATAAIVLLVTLPMAFALDWTSLLDLGESPSGDQVRWMMVVLASLASFGMVVSVPRQIMLGRMHGYIAHMLDIASIILGGGALIVSIVLDAPLWVMALAFMGPSSLFMIIGGLVYLRKAGIPLFTRAGLHRETLIQLSGDSLRMLVYHGAYSVSSQSDLFLIGIILGAPAAAIYGVAQRIFSLPIMIASAVNQAQWPALARADVSGDKSLVENMLRLTLLIGSGAAVIVAVIVATAYQTLLEFWLGYHLETDLVLLFGMVVWVLVATLVSTLDSALRARNETKLLMRAMLAMALINLTTSLALLNLIGPAGAIWGSVTGYILALLLPYSIKMRKVLAGTKPIKKGMHSGG